VVKRGDQKKMLRTLMLPPFRKELTVVANGAKSLLFFPIEE
jgi:hypothetical protein